MTQPGPDRLNVCHVITRLIVGGAQENTLLTCEELHRRGHRVALITGPDAGPEGQLLEEARGAGYEVIVLPSLRRAVRPRDDRRARRELASQYRRIRPDIVHTHSSKAGILGRFAARDAGVPIIVHTIHGMSFNRTQPWAVRTLYRAFERRAGRNTTRLISVADAMTAQAVAAGIAPAERFTTIYSGMRTEWFDPARFDRGSVRAAWGFGPETVVAGTVARLFRNKGYEQLIPAMARAAGRCERLRFVWVGDGAQRELYEGRLRELRLRDRVHLTGLVPPARVGMDLLVHASQWEGLPRAAVQALLMRVPVISFDIDGAPEVVIPNQTGVLVPLNDVPRLAKAIAALAADPPKRAELGRNGRELCLRRFDWRVMVEQLEALYLGMARPCSPPEGMPISRSE